MADRHPSFHVQVMSTERDRRNGERESGIFFVVFQLVTNKHLQFRPNPNPNPITFFTTITINKNIADIFVEHNDHL